jgi:hypothetical protein
LRQFSFSGYQIIFLPARPISDLMSKRKYPAPEGIIIVAVPNITFANYYPAIGNKMMNSCGRVAGTRSPF